MSIAFLTLGGLALAGAYFGFKKKDPSMNLSSCFFDKLATPLYTFFNEYHSNSLFLIDSINEDHILCNTPYPELYGVEISSKSTLINFFDENSINILIRDYKDEPNSFFYYVLHKQGNFQKQYIFSHNKNIINVFSRYFNTPFLSGVDICNALYNQYLQNNFYIKDKKMNTALKIEKKTVLDEPEFMSFKRLAKQAIRKNYKDINIFQGFKHLDIKNSSIEQIFKLNFEGSIWVYFDISSSQIEKHIDKLINYSKIVGDKKPFVDLKDSYEKKECDLVIVNAIAYLKNFNSDIIGNLGSSLKTSFISKEIFKSSHLQKMPLKFRDDEFDFIVKDDFLNNFIASVHKKNIDNPDIFGIDQNGSFTNYSFTEENFNGHSCIIAKSGAGKSVSKQKIISQMIELNFKNGKCNNLGKESKNVRVRSYDIGFSDDKLINLIKNNSENNIAHISSDFYTFSYNIVAFINFDNKVIFEADLQFNTDLLSIILETQNSDPLTINEASCFKDIIKRIYIDNNFQRYRIRDLKDKNLELYEKLLKLGYSESTFLMDIKENEFNFLKVPLLNDVVKYANREGQNQQLKENERIDYLNLARKLDGINKLGMFSHFDNINIADVDFLSMDLNNFKDSSLFVPIFLCIFQKTYYKDRDYAIKLMNKGLARPKLFYAIEEAVNYFRVEYFSVMFEKLAFEARKYNVHLCFITQDAGHIPKKILKNLNTRIFLLDPEKKQEAIDEAIEAFNIPKNVENALINTNIYEMCIWYSKGVFNLKFDISEEEMAFFSTNPNDDESNKK
ncbi:ATP-binding protein [Campylobacter lari]|nr:ATP-binding protein [Campylobacter lari]EAK5787106.1 ATP-binding protein [Campylobacter lari]